MANISPRIEQLTRLICRKCSELAGPDGLCQTHHDSADICPCCGMAISPDKLHGFLLTIAERSAINARLFR